MAWSEITKTVALWLINSAAEKLDAQIIQKALLLGVAKMRVLAAETKTVIDDWAIDQIEAWVRDAAKVEQIRQFILDRLSKLCAAPDSNQDPYKELVESLEVSNKNECGGPVENAILEKILFYILTAVIEYFQNKGDE